MKELDEMQKICEKLKSEIKKQDETQRFQTRLKTKQMFQHRHKMKLGNRENIL